MEKSIPVMLTASGVALAAPGYIAGMLVGMDNTNDPQITVFNHASAASGDQVIPTTNLDASAKGFNGFMGPMKIRCSIGAYVLVENSGGGAWTPGAIEITVFTIPDNQDGWK